MSPIELEQRMPVLRIQIESLYNFLKTSGFLFQYPDEALPGPDARTEEVLANIASIAGRVPSALAHFYRLIGSVNFNGHHPDWTGCDLPDPLVVFPITYAESELADYLADAEEYKEAFGTFRIPVAPDALHKEGTSGGMWYGIPVPFKDLDPPLLDEPRHTSFLSYLDIDTAESAS